jgi:hypothetical protein
MNACLGLEWLGMCKYDPAAPTPIYFGFGQAVSALAFTIAVQQLLKPIYRFRLGARYLSLTHLYICVFVGTILTLIAAIVPNISALHDNPFGYPIVWEMMGALLFVTAYGAVAIAIVLPVRVRKNRIAPFARNAATLLSSANEPDHLDLLQDLHRSLPVLIDVARFTDYLRDTSAFFDFIYRNEIERASYANTLLRIIADPLFCETLVRRAPWRVVTILREVSEKQLYAMGAEQFVRSLAQQAIMRDDSMMAREVGYHGFGTAPLLSDSLFSDIFIIIQYNPLDTFHYSSASNITAPLIKRFNAAAQRSFETLIEHRHIYRAQVAFSIGGFYKSVFMRASSMQEEDRYDFNLDFEMGTAVRKAMQLANKLLASVSVQEYDRLFINDQKQHVFDVLEILTEIVFEAIEGISNRFTGFDDRFWHLAIRVFMDGFPTTGQPPDGMTPFEQRLALKIVEKIHENMEGWYPALSRVILACLGPYQRVSQQPNRTAFNILRDAVYREFQQFQQLATSKPDRIDKFLPDNVTYDASNNRLSHTYRGGAVTVTDLSTLNIPTVSLIDPGIRRRLTEEERRDAERIW